MPSSRIAEAVATLASGGKVLVVDEVGRENEGDLIMAAEHATTDHVAFFLEHTSGFLGAAIDTESQDTAFLVSVDYKHATTTGISAADRVATIHALADPATTQDDLARPGHVMPCAPKQEE